MSYLYRLLAANQLGIESPFLLILIIGFALALVVRVWSVNKTACMWNQKLEAYADHLTFSECLSYRQERELRAKCFDPDYKDYFDVRKWHISHFVRDHLLMEKIDGYLSDVHNKGSRCCKGERAPKHD